MATRILSYVKGRESWRIMQGLQGYYHRSVSSSRPWSVGIPATLSQEEVEATFEHLPSHVASVSPKDLQYKGTYEIGTSSTACFRFATPEGDVFTIRFPAGMVQTLQAAFKTKNVSALRMALSVVAYMVERGLPEIVMAGDGPLFDIMQRQFAEPLPKAHEDHVSDDSQPTLEG